MEQALREYRGFLHYLCFISAWLEKAKKQLSRGENISEEELSNYLIDMEIAKRELLERKKLLGISGELDFMDDVRFQGFQFVGGELSGDYENFKKIIYPWVNEFDMKNPYTYEVGVLLLSHYMMQHGLWEEENTKKRTFKLSKVKAWFVSKLRRFIKRKKKEV